MVTNKLNKKNYRVAIKYGNSNNRKSNYHVVIKLW